MKRILLLKLTFFLSLSHAITVNDLAREVSRTMQQTLPIPVTKNISLNRVFPVNNSAIFLVNTINPYSDYQQAKKDGNEYVIDDYQKTKHIAKQKLLKTMCSMQETREYLHLGLKIHVQYISSDDYPLFDYHIEENDCVDNKLFPKKELASSDYLWAKASYTIKLMPLIKNLPKKENQAFLFLLKNKYENQFTDKLKNKLSREEYKSIMDDIGFNYLIISMLTYNEKLNKNYQDLRDLMFDMQLEIIEEKKFLRKLKKLTKAIDTDMETKKKVFDNYLHELNSTHKFIQMMIIESKNTTKAL